MKLKSPRLEKRFMNRDSLIWLTEVVFFVIKIKINTHLSSPIPDIDYYRTYNKQTWLKTCDQWKLGRLAGWFGNFRLRSKIRLGQTGVKKYILQYRCQFHLRLRAHFSYVVILFGSLSTFGFVIFGAKIL